MLPPLRQEPATPVHPRDVIDALGNRPDTNIIRIECGVASPRDGKLSAVTSVTPPTRPDLENLKAYQDAKLLAANPQQVGEQIKTFVSPETEIPLGVSPPTVPVQVAEAEGWPVVSVAEETGRQK